MQKVAVKVIKDFPGFSEGSEFELNKYQVYRDKTAGITLTKKFFKSYPDFFEVIEPEDISKEMWSVYENGAIEFKNESDMIIGYVTHGTHVHFTEKRRKAIKAVPKVIKTLKRSLKNSEYLDNKTLIKELLNLFEHGE